MGVSLQKGGKVSLTKEAGPAGLTKIKVGLGWDARATDGEKFDLDAAAFLLAATGKVRSDADFIFYGQKEAADGSVKHGGDNTTGQGDGDDETILIDLTKVGADVGKIAITCTIHKAASRRQNFGMVSNAYIRVVNEDTNTELARYDLSEDYSTETALIFGAVYKHNGEWKFEANGQGYAGGLKPLAEGFGVSIDGDE